VIGISVKAKRDILIGNTYWYVTVDSAVVVVAAAAADGDDDDDDDGGDGVPVLVVIVMLNDLSLISSVYFRLAACCICTLNCF